MQLETKYDEITVPIANSKRSALGKREGMTGGLKVDLSEIPQQVLVNLLIGAIEKHVQDGLKSLDKDNCTREDVIEAMTARVELLKSGATSVSKEGRKPPARNPVRTLARSLLRKAIQDRSDEKLDSKVLTKTITDLYKAHGEYVKAAKKEDEATMAQLEGPHSLVENALKTARNNLKEQAALGATLASVVTKAKKDSANAPKPEKKADAPKAAAATPKKKKAQTGGPSA